MRRTAVLLLVLAATARADEKSGLEVPRDGFEFDAQLTGQGERMNYGPFLAYSLISAHREPPRDKKDPGALDPGLRPGKTPPIHLRAINVYLGGRYAAAFDTESCSYAAAWAGGFLNISRTNLNGYKGDDLAYLRRPVLFQNAAVPGWSADGSFKDPRPAALGSLPRDVVHYKGLYLHGWKTVLSYTAGKSRVLEYPHMLARGKTAVFCRTVQVDHSDEDRYLFVCDLPGAAGRAEGPSFARLERKDAALVVGTASTPKGAELRVVDSKIALKVPAHRETITFNVYLARDLGTAALRELIENGPPADLVQWCKGGPARWEQPLTTRGKRGADDGAYALDTIALPEKNPWNSWMRPGALDFFADGRAALCTWSGDVWIVSGLDDKLERVTWKRYATGIFEALGLKVKDDVVYVLGRDQITRLHDLNDDGEADFYENFNNDGPTAPSFHSFAMELHTDRAGNFYYSRGAHRVKPGTPMHGGVIKVAKDGSKAELVCSGFREANGLGVGPDDTITLADNQGNWVPSSKIDVIRPGRFYGYVWGKKDSPPEAPLCWLPMQEDNSSGGQVWVTSDRWGPLKGGLLHTSYGSCKLFHVLVQRDGDRFQGGICAFPFVFDSGVMRGRFNPSDGQLYLCGLKGWGSKAKEDGCFQRVRYTGKPVLMPTSLRVKHDAVELGFAVEMDAASVKLESFDVAQWNYRWTEDYGSKDYSVADPKRQARDRVTVKAATLSADRKTVTLSIPGLKPVMQMGIEMALWSGDGSPVKAAVYHTINYIP